ncbi:hypothetical protein [Yersinia intermedia]|uniref:hypothetical protein n=1 Tax=Yersinia intermedia TaxID=631 RepID=UPI001CFC9DA6|nr:hypothetical protein [Yersinia intermedia]MCB5322075.1 hypothetical protein [Yersinia intermedia]MCB5325170.1 hypothetical protein [Yersinia intermedia]
MKLIALKQIYFGYSVLENGQEFETGEQHGRELLKKGYAKLPEVLQPTEQTEPAPETNAGGKKTKAK